MQLSGSRCARVVKQCPRLYLCWEEDLPLAMQEVRSQIHDTLPLRPLTRFTFDFRDFRGKQYHYPLAHLFDNQSAAVLL